MILLCIHSKVGTPSNCACTKKSETQYGCLIVGKSDAFLPLHSRTKNDVCLTTRLGMFLHVACCDN